MYVKIKNRGFGTSVRSLFHLYVVKTLDHSITCSAHSIGVIKHPPIAFSSGATTRSTIKSHPGSAKNRLGRYFLVLFASTQQDLLNFIPYHNGVSTKPVACHLSSVEKTTVVSRHLNCRYRVQCFFNM